MNELNGKTAIITGAEGAKVAAVGRNGEALAELSNEIKANGGAVKTIRADVTDEKDLQKIVQETVQEYGQVDVLVNAAGIILNGSIETTSAADYDALMNVNVRSVFLLTQSVLPLLEKTKGNIVNVSSVTGLRAFPGVLAYCISKAAIDQLTRCAALELAPKQIRVNAVNPGVVITDLHKRGGMSKENYAAFIERTATTHPLGRAGKPEEIADLILFLASERAAWITGATYSIDGGRAQTCAR
jgi:NAD(P)-dependent dehydrogenase (short-subunit alcohol dehydrogenase family)